MKKKVKKTALVKSKPVTKSKRAVKPVKKAAKKTSLTASNRKAVFDGADNISLTKNKIVVTRTQTKNSPGRFVKIETRNYYPQSAENLKAFQKAVEKKPLKKASVTVR